MCATLACAGLAHPDLVWFRQGQGKFGESLSGKVWSGLAQGMEWVTRCTLSLLSYIESAEAPGLEACRSHFQ